MALPHPSGGSGNGGGLELDAVGNLWTVGQDSGTAFLIESGLPAFSDVSWLTIAPATGSVAPNASTTVDVHVDTSGLATGVYRAIGLVQTNDPDLGTVQVPITLVVPAYQQGVNAGGPTYVDPATATVFASDRRFSTGRFGYVGTSATRSTRVAIGGTERDPLYQTLRTGMTGYRFAVPNGVYRVDLSFAELQATRVGARVFIVSIEGGAALSSVDVVAASGGRYIALDRSLLVEVSDGVLDVSFISQRGDGPIVNGILVTEIPAGSPGS